MTKEEIFSQLKPLIADSLSVIENEIIPELLFTDDLGADSLDQVELCMRIEKKFDIAFSDKEMESIKTVQDAVDLVYLRQ